MAGTSSKAGRVRLASALYGADYPLDTVMVKDGIVNNLCHQADSNMSQARVRFTGQAVGGKTGYFITPFTVLANYPQWIRTFGPWPLPVRANGNSYKLRVRFAGASSGGHAVSFWAALAPPGVPTARLREYLDLSTDAVFHTADTSSATAAWLTGATTMTAYTTMMGLSAPEVEACRREVDTLMPDGSTVVAGYQCFVSLYILGTTANVASTPRLHGVTADDWVG